jgi:CoA:oxalate CoA-transferase
LEKIFVKKSQAEWIRIFEENGVPCGAIYTLAQVFENPQVKARAMVLGAEHKKAGKIKMLGIPVKLAETPGLPQNAPPLLGEHTEEIFKRFGDELTPS